MVYWAGSYWSSVPCRISFLQSSGMHPVVFTSRPLGSICLYLPLDRLCWWRAGGIFLLPLSPGWFPPHSPTRLCKTLLIFVSNQWVPVTTKCINLDFSSFLFSSSSHPEVPWEFPKFIINKATRGSVILSMLKQTNEQSEPTTENGKAATQQITASLRSPAL